MQKMMSMLKNEQSFVSTMFRVGFGILFILVAVKKFRMGYGGFADSLVNPADPTNISSEIPAFLLYIYGYAIPALELIAGVMLLLNKKVMEAYGLIALIYISFIFGQMYNGNTSKIGTEYFPSMLALAAGVMAYKREREMM